MTHPQLPTHWLTNNSFFESRNLHADQLDLWFKVIAVAQGAVLDFCTVIIDGVDRVVQELGDAAAVLDAQADEGKDAQVSAQHPLVGQGDAAFGLQQGIEIVHEGMTITNGKA